MLFSSYLSEVTSSAEISARVPGFRAGRLLSAILMPAPLVLVSLLGPTLPVFAATDLKPDKAHLVESYGKTPLNFEPNRGQTSPEVQWIARGPEYALFLSGHDAVLELNSITPAKGITDRPKIDSSAVRMNLLGTTPAFQTRGEEHHGGIANYFTGNDPAKWQREVPNFEKVRLSGVYPGIDLVYYGRQGRLEYDFVVSPGADASKIALKFDGAEARLAGNGDLILPVAGTNREIRFDKPTVYQVKDGQRQPVEGAFHIASDMTVSFALGSYDRRRELVIDPTLLFAGSIATGNQQTIPAAMTIDSTGAMYVTGYTNDLTFPVTTGAFQTNCQVPTSNGAGNGRCGPSSNTSAFVTKISADGTSLVYSTYLHGGGGYETGQAITIDAQGDAYVLGATSSNDFPITSNAYQSLCQPYSNGNGGFTSQCDNFYDGGGTEYTVNGPNLFISKLNPTGTALLYSTFFGGSASVYAVGIALDTAGNIYFASEVNAAQNAANLYPFNNQIPFPTTTTGYQTIGIGVLTPALSKLSADGQTLMYSTFLGSQTLGVGHDSRDQAFALGQNGIAYIGGYTQTADFPTTAGSFKPTCAPYANDTSYCNTNQGFVAGFDTTKVGPASLLYSSYLGGDEGQTSNIPEQEVYGLAADANNNLFVTGYTSANDFPSTAGVYQPHCNVANPTGNCNQTAFLSKINPTGSALTWSTFLGDTRDGGPGGYGASIAFDAKAQVYLYGLSDDGGGSFPQVDPISTYTGGNKVFLATFSADATQLKFSTRFSGPSNNGISLAPSANGLAIDAAGSMYIVGYSGDGGSFGSTTGTYSTTATSGFNRPFFAKISAVTAQSATTLTVTPSPASSGQTITFSAAEAGDGSTTAVPSGTVTITVSGVSPMPTVLGTITLDSTGKGTFSTSMLSSGTYSVQAAYSGDSNFEPSQSAVQALAVTGPITQNLLLNPGAELGSLADWTIGGAGTPQVDSGSFDQGITPHTGSYDFVGGSNSGTDSLSQTVSIVAQGTGITAAQVDGGTLFANVSFWEQGLNQGTPSDDGSITLTFLDGNNATVSTVTTSTVDSHNGTWTNGAGVYAIPVGTRSITYTMNFVKNQLADNDAFIDDNSLSISTNTGLTLFPQSLHFGNVAVGSQSAPQTVTVTNQQTFTINIIQIMSELGANPNDFLQTNNCPAALAAGATCQVTVTFVPDGVGPKLAGIDLPDDSLPSDQYIRVDGTGTGGILQVNPGNLKTIAGIGILGDTGDGEPAINAELKQPNGVAFDPAGNLYIADDEANVVRKVDTAGIITTFAGSGTSGFAGDGGPAAMAELSIPFSVASDAAGNIYIQDTGNYVIRKVTAATGIITTFAGTPGVPGHSGDGGPATQARFNNNQGARFDNAGNLYVPTCRGASIRKIDTAGNISTVAGNFTQGYSGDGGQATNAQLQCPSGVAIDAAGNLYIADASNNVIRKVNTQGIISTIAGSPNGAAGSSGDGGAATAALLSLPNDVALDGVGNLYIADSANNRVRKIDTNGIITTAAGGLDNAGSAAVNTPLGLTTDTAGNVYFSDSGNGKIQEIFPQGVQPFPPTQVGATSAPQTLTLSNIGNVDVTLGADGAFNLSGNSGDFALTPMTCGGGMVLTANGGSCAVSITFTPTAVGQRTLTVMISDNALNTPQSFSIGGTGTPAGPVTPTITWAPPGSIPYGTPLSATQLNAVATGTGGVVVNGTYVYTPAAGAVLTAGAHPLSVTFTPTDAGYLPATGTTSITVTPFTPVLTWPTPASITTATPLSATQLDAVATDINGATVAGSYFYTPDVGSLLTAGLQTLTVTFDPTDTVDFTSVGTSRTIVVTQMAAAASATSLAVTSAGGAVTTVAAGSVVTLTATVVAGTALVTPGQVAFCDATALSCTGSHRLALAQVTGSGKANYSFVPGIGAHSYIAVFLGASLYSGSSSAAAVLTVTGTYPTASTIAQSGTAGNYSLTATTVGAAPYRTQANTQSVTINLGQSAQNYVLTGTGPSTINGSTYGNYYNTQGSCVTAGSITACDLTGAFTSSTPAYAAGTYDFQTVFSGSISSAVVSQTQSPVGTNPPNDFQYSAFAPSTTMTLKLNVTGGGSYAIPVVVNGNYAASLDGIGFADISAVCGGTSLGNTPCQQDYVGTIAGATYSSTITGSVAFEMPLLPSLSGPTGTVSFLDTSNGNAVLGSSVLGAPTAAFALTPATGSPVGVGAGAYGVATGDFNGDGFADIVTGNYNAGTVSVLLGKGDGTFQPQVTYAVGRLPERVLVADLNGDGTLDLVVANTGSNTIGVLLGNGDGTFQAQVTYAAASPVGLGVMDINHDGIPDVVAGDYYANTMSVLLGNGDGTLKAAVTYPTGRTPQTVAEGDFNGDGNVDVVVGNEGGATVGIFLGNGDGTFQAMVTYAVGNLPQGVQVGDFNADGKQDLAVSNQGDGTVGVLLGNGDGTFQPQITYPVGVQPVGLAIADFNGDGIEDITVGNTGQASLTQGVLLGKGDGTFQPQVTFATGNFPYGVAVADFNGDGLPDMAVAAFTDATATILLSQATETTTATVTGIAPQGGGAHQVAASYLGDIGYGASISAPTPLLGITSTPVITWTPAVATIPYGTALGAQQLNATAATAAGIAIPGTFVYTPAAGTVLMAGTQTLSEAFTPTSTLYSTATGSATIVVTQAMTVITWATPGMISYGTALGAQQLNATAATATGLAIPGTFIYSPAAGTVLAPGMQTLSVVFTPTDALDYTTGTASVPIVVGGPSLTSFTPVGVLIGSGDTTITLIGAGFVPTSMVMVNGAAVATAYVSPTMLTAVVPAALLKATGLLAVTVFDPSIGASTVAQTFAVVPPTGAASLSGPATTDPGSQPTVTLAITNPYPLALTAQFSLAFASAGTTQVDDPSIQFSTGGRTYNYTVAANSTSVPPVQLQAGTDAGTITITAKLMADGVDVTPAGLAPLVIVVPPVVPTISGTTIAATGGTLTVVVHGFSNTREVSSAVFDFTAATGDVLATPSVTIPATTIFGAWYGDAASVAYGSTFTYTQVFDTSADAKTIGSVKVTLTNSVGVSAASTSP